MKWSWITLVAVAFLAVLPGSVAADVPDHTGPASADDALKPDGRPWNPEHDPADRRVFDRLDATAVPGHVTPPFECTAAGSRPPGFSAFLVSGLAGVVFIGFAAALARRRQIGMWFSAVRRTGISGMVPDDAAAVGWIIAAAFAVRVVFALLIPLHGSEWGSVEFIPLGDVLFHGYEVLTNPPLLNFVEHFVYPVCTAPICFRMPTVLAGLVLIWAARCTGRELAGRRAGLLAAAFCAVHCGLVVWSATMRAYLPMAAFVLSAVPSAYRLAGGRGRDRDAVGLAVFGALAVWTHYIALLWLSGLFLLILAGRRRDGRSLFRAATALVWIAAAFLPLAPFFFSDFGTKQSSMLPAGYAAHLLAIATGLPFGAGIVTCAVPVAMRLRANGPLLWLTLLVGGYLALNLSTAGFIYWEVSYSVGLAGFVMVAVAIAISGFRSFRKIAVGFMALLVVAWIPVLMQPTVDFAVAEAARPFLWRSASNRLFADIMKKERSDTRVAGASCGNVLVTPAFESEPYLYYLGPVTAGEAGVEPVEARNFDEMSVEPPGGGPSRSWTVIGFERYWSWLYGQWPELQRFLERKGCFWYARLQQNCQTGKGLTYSSWDCQWLSRNCKLVESTAFDQLYLCGEAGASGRLR